MYANFILYKYAALKYHKLVVTQVYSSNSFVVVAFSSVIIDSEAFSQIKQTDIAASKIGENSFY